MPAGTTPIFPAAPYAVSASLAAVSACATRAPTVTASLAAANISLLVPTSVNGCRVDVVRVKACSNSITAATAAQLVQLWLWDGTTAYLYDEISVTAVTPSASVASFLAERGYANLILPATFALYISTTVATTASTTALEVQAVGGLY